MEEELKGLSKQEVEERIKDKKVNKVKAKTDTTFLKIIRKNLFTYFNLIFLIISILLIACKSYRNLTFLPVIILNILIGIVQQIKAKIVLDKLSLLDKAKFKTIRDGKEQKVRTDKLVKDDLIILEPGYQIPADAILIKGKIFVNESMLTGEQDEIEKNINSDLLSGSFVVSGKGIAKLTKVGDESYSAKLMKSSKKIKEAKSEMISSIDAIVKMAGILIIPIGIALFLQSYLINKNTFETSTVSMVSAVIGMIPEGLYLLTTISLDMSAKRLAKEKVMLHDMRSIETLARVDVLAIDKTGTITTNKMEVTDFYINDIKSNNLYGYKKADEILENANVIQFGKYINTIEDTNITMEALKKYGKKITGEKLDYKEKQEFSSKNKFSFIKVNENLTYKLGAPEICISNLENYKDLLNKKEENGERVLAFVKIENNKEQVLCLISLKNEIRKNAKEIFEYFKEQEVGIRVISGDNPKTVSNIAKQVGIDGYDRYVDCRELKKYSDIKKAVKKYVIFGRVSPEQKKQIVKALKEEGLKVAFSGDGINDILAMKMADCSISLGSGAEAAREVAQVVLLDDDFAKMKNIVYEGRKNINNITRSASLFVYKNSFSLLLALYSIIFMKTYPLEPTQVSLGSIFTIGAPGFLLAFEENQKKPKEGNFLKRVLKNSLPAAITSFLAIVALVAFSNLFGMGEHEISTACSYLFFVGGFLMLYKIIRPVNLYRAFVMFLCLLGMVLTIRYIPKFFAINKISPRSAGLVALFGIAEFSVIRWVSLILDKIERKMDKKKDKKIDIISKITNN